MQTLTEADLKLISDNGVTLEEVAHVLTMFPQSVETAIAAVLMAKQGMGQDRNKPFQTQTEANADVSGGAGDLTSGDAAQT